MQKYDLIILTDLPAFYKNRLFNEINRHRKLLVVYTYRTSSKRNKDFITGSFEYEHIFLSSKSWLVAMGQLMKLLYSVNYHEIIICGWNKIYHYAVAMASSKSKNSMMIESSYHESVTIGVRGLIKKLLLKRITKIYVPGSSNEKLCRELGFKGKIVITKGVGVFNYVKQPSYEPRSQVQNFLYVGRFSPEKNLLFLIDTFNTLPQFTLNLIGFGPQCEELKAKSGENINIIGPINNIDLPQYYAANDVFILPSLSETWGLVVEEALNNGIPVILSNHVGCAEELMKGEDYGLVFDIGCPNSLRECILKISNIEIYNKMRKNISLLDFEAVEKSQVSCYLQE